MCAANSWVLVIETSSAKERERERMSNSASPKSLVRDLLLSVVMASAATWLVGRLLKMLDPTRPDAREVGRKKKEIERRLGRKDVETNQYEDVIALDVINPDHIEVTFDDIGGLEKTKEALQELVIEPFKRPELFTGGNLLRPVKGVLLYGPPGTGKTMLAQAVAKESSACFINIKASSLQSKWFGDAQRLVNAVFTLAWKLAPSIIFIDEVDAFLSSRKTGDQEPVNTMKTEFMAMWDGMMTRNDTLITVLAATNRPWDVDEAILRRLPRSFEVALPGVNERAGILRSILQGEIGARGFDISTSIHSPLYRIAAKVEGFSGSDLRELCRQAAYCPVRELIRSERSGKVPKEGEVLVPRPICEEDFMNSIKTSAPTRDAARSYHERYETGTSIPRARSRNAMAAEFNGGPTVDIDALVELLSAVGSFRGDASRSQSGSMDDLE